MLNTYLRRHTSHTHLPITRFRNIARIVAGILLGGYLLLLFVVNFTPIQHLLADMVENALKEKLGTEVKISRVEIGLFNRVILHDVYIEDRQRAPMLTGNLMSAKIEYRALLDGRVSLRSVSLLDGKINLYKTKPTARPTTSSCSMPSSLTQKSRHTST